jgi:hypothetical protein
MLANRVPYYKVRAANLVDVFHLRGFSDPEPSRMSSRALTDYNGTTQSALHPPVLYESPDIFDYPITRGIDVYQAGAYTELQQDILRIYQAGAYAEVEQELIRLYQEGAYVEFKAIWKVLVAHGFLYAEIKNIWLIDVANAFLYAEIQDTEAVRVTQSVAEMLIRYDPPARVTQVVAEVLIREEQTPPETMTIAPVAMSKNVPIIFRM